ncbi:MAG: HEAT repeat domain-containing protein [Acidobacteriota bacterium]
MTRRGALLLFVMAGCAPPPAPPAVPVTLSGETVSAWVRRAAAEEPAARAVFEGADPRVLPVLVGGLQAPDESVRRGSRSALLAMKERVAPAEAELALVVERGAPEASGAAADVLACEGRRGIHALCEVLRVRGATDRGLGLRILRAIAGGGTASLRGDDASVARSALFAMLDDDDGRVRESALALLPIVGPGDEPERIEVMATLLSDGDFGVRGAAVDAIASVGARAIPVLEDVAASESAERRRQAIRTLAKIPRSQRTESRPADDADLATIVSAVAGGLDDPVALTAALRAVAASGGPGVDHAFPSSLMELALAAEREPSLCSRRFQALVGSALAAVDGEATLTRMLESGDRDERRAAAAAAAGISGATDALESTLRRLEDDADPVVRRLAGAALARACPS